jgi:hypothetical protein
MQGEGFDVVDCDRVQMSPVIHGWVMSCEPPDCSLRHLQVQGQHIRDGAVPPADDNITVYLRWTCVASARRPGLRRHS